MSKFKKGDKVVWITGQGQWRGVITDGPFQAIREGDYSFENDAYVVMFRRELPAFDTARLLGENVLQKVTEENF